MPDHKRQDHGPIYIHEDEMDWETLRFPGHHSKMVLHPSPDDPTHPNAGFHIPGVPEYLWRIRPVGSPAQERCGGMDGVQPDEPPEPRASAGVLSGRDAGGIARARGRLTRRKNKGRRVGDGPEQHCDRVTDQDIRYPHSWMRWSSPSPTGCLRWPPSFVERASSQSVNSGMMEPPSSHMICCASQ